MARRPGAPNAVLVLGEFVDPEDAAVPLSGSLGFPALDDPEEVVPATTRRRVFAGYAGWEAGQLENELGREDWIIEEALNDAHSPRIRSTSGRTCCAGKGGIYELVARIPDDPSVN